MKERGPRLRSGQDGTRRGGEGGKQGPGGTAQRSLMRFCFGDRDGRLRGEPRARRPDTGRPEGRGGGDGPGRAGPRRGGCDRARPSRRWEGCSCCKSRGLKRGEPTCGACAPVSVVLWLDVAQVTGASPEQSCLTGTQGPPRKPGV